MPSEYQKASAIASALELLAALQHFLPFHYAVPPCLVFQIHGSSKVKKSVATIL
jgi:hypothetical protein